MKLPRSPSILADHRSVAAFTMIEVAMSLAIVAFALVAIIGVMPTGLNVQRQNAEETIISQDGTYLLEMLKHGSLSTSLGHITNNLTLLDVKCERVPVTSTPIGNVQSNFWTIANSNKLSIEQILLQMSRPKRSETFYDGASSYYYFTNSVRMRFFAMSGNMTAVIGEDDDKMQYEVQVEVIPGGAGIINSNVFATNQFTSVFAQANLHTIKLTYRWPVLPNQQLGSGRKVLMTQVRGHLRPTKMSGGNLTAIDPDDVTEIQRLNDATVMFNYGHIFEGAMLR